VVGVGQEHVTERVRRLMEDDDDGKLLLCAEGVGLQHQWRDLHSLCLFSDSFARCVRQSTAHLAQPRRVTLSLTASPALHSQLIEEVEHYLQSPAPKTSEIVLEVSNSLACSLQCADDHAGAHALCVMSH
jgi:hypothetical protein